MIHPTSQPNPPTQTPTNPRGKKIKTLAGLLVTCYLLLVTCYSPSTTHAAEVQLGIVHDIAVGIGASIIAPPNSEALSAYCAPPGSPLDRETYIAGNCEKGPGSATIISGLNRGMVAMIAHPPASSQDYIADVAKSLNLATPAYAQGIGFGALNPILPLWKLSRNIAYLFFTLVFIIIGFMVMLRKRINPQTVVNIQSALPKLVITLILISSSYAIAGFLIDIMYISISVLVAVFTQFVFSSATNVEEVAYDNNIISNMLSLADPRDVAGNSAAAVGGIVEDIINADIIGRLFNWGAQALAFLIFAIAIMAQTFRVFFAMLTSYLFVILGVIFAPFQLMLNATPGSNAFNSWVRSLFANLMTFPIVIGLLLITKALVGNDTQSGIGFSQGGFAPPQLHLGVENISALLGLAMIMIIPEVLKMFKEMMGVKDMGLGQVAAQNLGAGHRWATRPMGMVATAAFQQIGTNVGLHMWRRMRDRNLDRGGHGGNENNEARDAAVGATSASDQVGGGGPGLT